MLDGADGKSCNANGWQAMRLANLRNVIWQSMVVLHRYLGVAVGLLMVMWFVSGIVMMYVGLPDVTEDERARTLEPIAWQDCCRFPQGLAADDAQVCAAKNGPSAL
jgi:hypothetical protein